MKDRRKGLTVDEILAASDEEVGSWGRRKSDDLDGDVVKLRLIIDAAVRKSRLSQRWKDV